MCATCLWTRVPGARSALMGCSGEGGKAICTFGHQWGATSGAGFRWLKNQPFPGGSQSLSPASSSHEPNEAYLLFLIRFIRIFLILLNGWKKSIVFVIGENDMKLKIQCPHTELYWHTATRACISTACGGTRLEAQTLRFPKDTTGLYLLVSYSECLLHILIFLSEVWIVFFFAALSSFASSIKHPGNVYCFLQQVVFFIRTACILNV